MQLPRTTERELTTQVRIRPGDSLLIAGLVRENDNFSSSGAGFMKPILPTSRTATTDNLELVFLLRPRVIVGTSPTEQEYYNSVRGTAVADKNPAPPITDEILFDYDFAPLTQGDTETDDKSAGGSAPVIGSVPLQALDPAMLPP